MRLKRICAHVNIWLLIWMDGFSSHAYQAFASLGRLLAAGDDGGPRRSH